MSISAVITLGYGQGAKYIPTLGYLAGAAPPVVEEMTGRGGETFLYQTPYQKHRAEYKEDLPENTQAELERINAEITDVEREQEALNQQRIAKAKRAKQAKLEARLQEQINGLRIERARLMRMLNDEEAIIAILLSSPFN